MSHISHFFGLTNAENIDFDCLLSGDRLLPIAYTREHRTIYWSVQSQQIVIEEIKDGKHIVQPLNVNIPPEHQISYFLSLLFDGLDDVFCYSHHNAIHGNASTDEVDIDQIWFDLGKAIDINSPLGPSGEVLLMAAVQMGNRKGYPVF